MICFKNLQNFNVDSFFPQNLFDVWYCLFVCKECCYFWIKCQVLLFYQLWPKTEQCPFLRLMVILIAMRKDWWLVSISKNQYRLFFKWQPVPKAQLCCFYWFTQNHADPCIRNSREESPLDLAAQYGKMETVWIVLLFINLWSPCPCFVFTSISSISKFLAQDNDFPAFWLVPSAHDMSHYR